MEKKSTKKRASDKTVATSQPREAVDPFAETVNPVKVTKPVVKAVKSEDKTTEPPSKVTRKPGAAKMEPVDVITDAFAEPVSESQIAELSDTKPVDTARKRSRKKADADTIALELPKKPRLRRAKAASEIEVLEVAKPKSERKRASKKAVKTAGATVAEAPSVEPLEIVDITAELAATEPEVELSPVFKALADVKLPELTRENRARLQMQSPTTLYFYWTVKQNPWQQLRRVFGDDLGSYTLVLKLTELETGVEEMHACEAEGNWWFHVQPAGKYQAEIGFYAPNRPYFRVIYSNTVETPRRSPSPRPASEARWTVSATKFAEVLDVSGFTRDAFDVAIAGGDPIASSDVTFEAFQQLVGDSDVNIRQIPAEDIRDAMIALAAGNSLEQLRWRLSASIFAVLQANAEKLSATSAQNALTEHFDIDESEWTEYEMGPTVFGASRVNFPKTLKGRRVSPKTAARYNPLSSFSLRQ